MRIFWAPNRLYHPATSCTYQITEQNYVQVPGLRRRWQTSTFTFADWLAVTFDEHPLYDYRAAGGGGNIFKPSEATDCMSQTDRRHRCFKPATA